MGNLDLSFFSWDVIGPFVTKGFIFSIWLTIVATIGSGPTELRPEGAHRHCPRLPSRGLCEAIPR